MNKKKKQLRIEEKTIKAFKPRKTDHKREEKFFFLYFWKEEKPQSKIFNPTKQREKYKKGILFW
jgi:hypothetical protein